MYKFFNMSDPRWPNNLPPPPNPDRLQTFFFAMVDVTISQMNKENDPNAGKGGGTSRRRV